MDVAVEVEKVARRLLPACGGVLGAPHHHKSRGGKTSLQDCVLLCRFHHQVVIHKLGWTLVVSPDGTTTAWNKDHTRTLHSHGPPPHPG